MDRLTKRDEFGIGRVCHYPDRDGDKLLYNQILTSKPARDFYFLYEVLEDGSLKKLGKARSPTELEEKFDVKSRMSS